MLVPVSTVFASEMEIKTSNVVEYQNEDVHYLTEDLTRGSSKPGSNASVHDLNVSNYNYQLINFGYRLFTDKWLTSSSGVLVSSEKTVSSGSASVTWINIKPDKKYYVCFEVPTNGNRYSDNGTISD